MVPKINMIGRRIDRLVVIAPAKSCRSGLARWFCRCDCGEECVKYGADLRRVLVASCNSCFRNGVARRSTKHGDFGSKINRLWHNMKKRCLNKNAVNFKNYGGRGITIKQEWIDDYETFRKDILAEIGQPPSPRHTLDRIDNDKNYEPGNLRWATTIEQNHNRRKREP